MSRMIDLIKQSAVPANVMRSAARGACRCPRRRWLRFLSILSGHHLFAEQAKLTLAGFDQKRCSRLPPIRPRHKKCCTTWRRLKTSVRRWFPASRKSVAAFDDLLELAMSHSQEDFGRDGRQHARSQ